MALRQDIRLRWQRFKRGLEFFFYAPFDSLVCCSAAKPRDPCSIAIVQVELLGDYFLWRPYGMALVRALQAAGHERIHLICNAAHVQLVEIDFAKCQITALDMRRFVSSLWYRRSALLALKDLAPQQTLSSRHPRNSIMEDAIVLALGAPAMGFLAEAEDRSSMDRRYWRRSYRTLLTVPKDAHRSLIHQHFLDALGVPAPLSSTSLVSSAGPARQETLVLAPGASHPGRQWPPLQFALLLQDFLESHPSWHCVIVGASQDRRTGERIRAALPALLATRCENLCGETNLTELIDFVSTAGLVVGNDSAACHIAASLARPSVAVVGGGHFGRCFPYPKNAENAPVIATHRMLCFGCDWNCRFRRGTQEPFACVAAIPLNAVSESVGIALGEIV